MRKTATATTATAAELIEVDPCSLVLGANARLDTRPSKSLVASVRERGVLQAITAYRDADRQLVVVHGQRRTLAAVEAGRPTVPVIVRPAPDDVVRLVDQLSENEHRAGLSTAEKVQAYEQLAVLGVSAAQIAKRTAFRRPDVDAGLAVAGSAVARGATQRWEWLTLDQAAVVAEFDDDAEAVKKLVVAAKDGGFDHLAQRLRDQRADAAARAEATAAFTAAAGVTVVDPPPYDPKTSMKRLDQLTADGEVLTPQMHAQCPGHAAWLEEEWVSNGGDEDDDDSWSRGWVPVYVCTDYQAHGHAPRWGGHDSGRKTNAEMTAQEREQARAERRDVIDSNKAWDSAEAVRRDWLRTFLGRKTAPKAAAAFIATSLARADFAITRAFTGGNQLAYELLGIERTKRLHGGRGEDIAGVLATATEGRALLITLGLVLAAYEEATGRHSWRNVDPGTAHYLTLIQAQGYELADVEQRARGASEPEQTGG